MKQLLWLTSFMLITNCLSSQISTNNWESQMGDPNVSFFEIQQSYNEYWEGKEIPKGAGHKPFKRWEYFMETRVDKDGFYDPLQREKEYQRYLKNHPNYKSSSNQWSILGPEGEPSGNNGVGRINVIAVHPTDADKIYIGTPAGGLWTTTDGGASWTTNTDALQSLGISDIVFDPANADNMWAATGDRDHNDTSTTGIISSTDGGVTWSTTSFTPSTNGLPGFYLIHRLLIDPTDGDVMIASTTSGVWRTTDAWATWTEVLPNDCLRHMEFKPGDSDIVYGTTSGSYCGGLNSVATYFRSTDNGATWTQITLPNTVDLERIGIGVSDADPSKLYLLASHNDANDTNDFFALYHSTDSGATVSEISVSVVPDMGSQQWYDWSLTVSPTDEDLLFAGGVGLRTSTDGGVTWSSTGSGVHVDHHYAQYYGSTIFVGSDGGIWKSTNDGSTWTDLNNDLAITQYYRISNAETDNTRMLAGAQDNGTHQKIGSTWQFEYGGDGMDNAIDPNDELNLFVSWQYGNFYRSTNGGASFTSMIDSGTTGVSGAWVTPIKIDPSNTSTLYTGYDRIWKSTDDGVTWTDPYGSALTTSSSLQYIDVSNSNSNYIYTTDYLKVWKSTDAGVSWVEVTDPGSSIRWIEIDPTDEDHLWVCANNDILESTDGGSNWTNISGTLPNIDMNTIVYDEGTNEALYVGSDLGVYYKDGTMSDWAAFGTGLPNVIILELDIAENDNKLRAATFGRGVWEAPLTSIPCSVDNIVDLGVITCDDGLSVYDRSLEVSFTSAPLSGTLDVLGQSFTIGSSPQQVTLSALPLDGNNNNVTAEFSDDTGCSLTINNLFTSPSSCPCLISSANLIILPCDDNGTPTSSDDTFNFTIDPSGENNGSTYSVTGDVTANNLQYGTVHTFDNGGAGYLISDGDMIINIVDDSDGGCVLNNVDVPAPSACSTNYVCAEAFEITGSGTYSAIGPSQGNGGSQAGQNANWFYFTAPSDGMITVQSCGGGIDTRLFIHDGTCAGLTMLNTNDDFCEMSSGSQLYASFLEHCVYSGTTYYIEWDDRWSDLGFNFDFDFSTPSPTTVDTYPYDESFESTPNSWIISCDGDMTWTNHSGSTGSANTGPSAAQDGTQYLYTEASSNFNNIAYHLGPTFDLSTTSQPEFSFYYHMYGADMGTLDLEISTNGGSSWTNIFTKSGDQGNQWFQETIDLTSYSGQTIDIRFKGTVGPAFTSDMAIDNIKLVDINPPSCNPVTNVDENPIADGTYSGEIINSSGVVPSNGNVEFTALNEINLNAGFEVTVGGVFEATTGNCTGANSTQSESSGN